LVFGFSKNQILVAVISENYFEMGIKDPPQRAGEKKTKLDVRRYAVD